MTTISQPRIPKPETLEAKFALLARLPYDRRAGRKHSLVYGFVLDWWHKRYGDALASVRHIVAHLKERDPSGKGLFTGDVHSALTDLVNWGYLQQEKGSGRRASRYTPAWHLLDSVLANPNTTPADNSVLANPNADVRETPNATAASVHESPNEDPSTLTRVTDPGTGVDGPISAEVPPTGANAPDGTVALDGFEALWLAYGFRKQKAEARREYNRIGPDEALAASIVASATAWREAWAAQGKADAPRKHLHTWLRDEAYDCDPPGRPPTKAAKEAATAMSNADLFTIERSTVSRTGPSTYVEIIAKPFDEAAEGFDLFMNVTPGDRWGDKPRFDELLQALGEPELPDEAIARLRTDKLSALAGKPFRATRLNRGWTFESATRH